ncbi:MAG TPA: response regulator, partial [Lichenihabitans sp.]|nr:response regulator [Lichenihabitans sp.]
SGHIGLDIGYRNQIATLDVSDSGPGIDPANRKTIFEPFDRGPITGSEAVPGLGLGLTITKLLAELMGGEITLSSTPGAGSRFRVRLMLAAVADPTLSVARDVHGYVGRRRTILVVDDDGDHQALMRAILEPLGFSVIAARDGATCLNLVEDLRPDLFILDVSMPGMSGWDLARTLREAKRAEAPILMLSADIGEGSAAAPERGAADAILPKPFDLARLLDRLETLMGLEWSDAADPAATQDAPAKVIHPGNAVVAELLRLGGIGYVRGIEAKLDDLGRDPRLAALADALRGHVKAFDFDRYTGVLEGFGQRGTKP